jgi:hypothetical protein
VEVDTETATVAMLVPPDVRGTLATFSEAVGRLARLELDTATERVTVPAKPLLLRESVDVEGAEAPW